MRNKATSTQTGTGAPPSARELVQDMDLVVSAMKGIADVEAGRCAPVAEVRTRVLSRYEPAMAHP